MTTAATLNARMDAMLADAPTETLLDMLATSELETPATEEHMLVRVKVYEAIETRLTSPQRARFEMMFDDDHWGRYAYMPAAEQFRRAIEGRML